MDDTKLFGLTMSRARKNRVIVCTSLAVVFFVLYVACSISYRPKVVVTIPEGGLLSSVFEAQNMNYQKHTSFTGTYGYLDVPYKIDVPAGDEAVIGTSRVVSVNGLYFLYDSGDDLESVLKAGYTDVISLHAEPSSTVLTLLKSEEGYLHGCKAVYNVYEISVSEYEPFYCCAYALSPSESIGAIGKELYVACMTKGYSSETFVNLAGLCQANIGTLRYEEPREK